MIEGVKCERCGHPYLRDPRRTAMVRRSGPGESRTPWRRARDSNPRYRFTFISPKSTQKWLGFRAGFTINSAERMLAYISAPKTVPATIRDLGTRRGAASRASWRAGGVALRIGALVHGVAEGPRRT